MTLCLDKWKCLKFLYSGWILMSLTLHGYSSASLSQEVAVDENRLESDAPRPDNILFNGNLSDRGLHRKAKRLEIPNVVHVHDNSVEPRAGQSHTDYDEDKFFKIFQERETKQQPVPTITENSKETKSSTRPELTEKDQQRMKYFKRYSVLLLAWLIFPMSKASYFTIMELFDAYSDKLGVPPEVTFVSIVFLKCVDFVALTRGRVKYLDGSEKNMRSKMLDYFLTKLGAADHQKVAVQLLMPSSNWPRYEQ